MALLPCRRPAAALKAFLEQEFENKVEITELPDACGTGAFEVKAGDKLIHSKLTMGHGKCTSDEELDAIPPTLITSTRLALKSSIVAIATDTAWSSTSKESHPARKYLKYVLCIMNYR